MSEKSPNRPTIAVEPVSTDFRVSLRTRDLGLIQQRELSCIASGPHILAPGSLYQDLTALPGVDNVDYCNVAPLVTFSIEKHHDSAGIRRRIERLIAAHVAKARAWHLEVRRNAKIGKAASHVSNTKASRHVVALLTWIAANPNAEGTLLPRNEPSSAHDAHTHFLLECPTGRRKVACSVVTAAETYLQHGKRFVLNAKGKRLLARLGLAA